MSIRISLTIAESNVMMECVSSGMGWAAEAIKSPDIDDETARNITEKSVLLGQIGLKLMKQLGPYISTDADQNDSPASGGGS